MVLPFSDQVIQTKLNGYDSIVTNAEKLSRLGGGGTNCSAPIEHLNRIGKQADMVIFISDNQSWLDSNYSSGRTATIREWDYFRKYNPQAKLACIDIQPYGSAQARGSHGILNIGGFSDAVFKVLSAFASNQLTPGYWVQQIEKTPLL